MTLGGITEPKNRYGHFPKNLAGKSIFGNVPHHLIYHIHVDLTALPTVERNENRKFLMHSTVIILIARKKRSNKQTLTDECATRIDFHTHTIFLNSWSAANLVLLNILVSNPYRAILIIFLRLTLLVNWRLNPASPALDNSPSLVY